MRAGTVPSHGSSSLLFPLTKQSLICLLNSSNSRPQCLREVHAIILTTGFSVKNSLLTILLTRLLDSGYVSYARKLFDGMHKPRIFLWNTVLRGYFRNGMPRESLSLYLLMRARSVLPDEFALPFAVKTCGELSEFVAGRVVHCEGIKYGLEFFTEVRNELVLFYVKSGEMGLAEWLFDSMVKRDLVSWNTFMAGCVQMGSASKALALFSRMELAGVEPDAITVVSLLSACSQLGCLEIGERIYKNARTSSLDGNVVVENARLDMYMKCGNTELARAMFISMCYRNVISWSTMINGFAINGKGEEALDLFSRMQEEGIKPNHVTYLGVLSACVHAGRVSQGQAFFNCMIMKGIEPRREHYACMVDLLGRSGNLDEAHSFIKNMPMEQDAAIWGSLLGACAVHGYIEMGQIAADAVMELATDVASYQVLLSNMYAEAGNWDSVRKLRMRLRKKRVKKVAAYSSIELSGGIHVFYSGDKSHPRSKCIYETLEELCSLARSLGYVLGTNPVLEPPPAR